MRLFDVRLFDVRLLDVRFSGVRLFELRWGNDCTNPAGARDNPAGARTNDAAGDCAGPPAPGAKPATPAVPGPATRTSYMPVSAPIVVQTVPVYCPATPAYNTAGASNMPRSSWDFGRWPGY